MGELYFCLLLVLFLVNSSFAESQISLKVAEMTSTDTVLVKIPHQLEWPSTQQRKYKILSGKEYTYVEERSGVLKVKKEMDREKLCPDNREHCYIEVAVAVFPATEGTLPSIKMVKIQLEVTDINDNVPEFENKIIEKTMSEAVNIGTSIRLDSAVDPDYGSNSIQRYQLKAAPGSRGILKIFKLDEIENIDGTKIPKLELRKELDREREGIHELLLEAVDGGSPALTGTATVRINITDSNDNAPKFDKDIYVVKVNEHSKDGTPIFKLNAKDKDIGPNGVVIYKFPSVVSAEEREIFKLDPRSGLISVKNGRKLDFETKRVHHLSVEATDMGPNAVAAYATVTVKVQDVNDNKPVVDISFMDVAGVKEASSDSDYDAIIMENIDSGTFIAFVTITDKDGGENGTVSCRIPEDGIFQLSSIEGDASRFLLQVTGPLDREVKSFYDVNIDAWDHGTPPQTSTKTLKLKVGDVNDNKPKFFHEEFRVQVSETAKKDTVVITLKAKDRDEHPGPNSNITYTLLEGDDYILKGTKKFALTDIFTIDPYSGKVRLAIDDVLDAEMVRSPGYLTVLARDNGSPPLNATTKLKITVIDENDNSPVFEKESYIFHINEHSGDGQFIGVVKATDADWSKDSNGKLTYTIENFKSTDEGDNSDVDESQWLYMFQIEGKSGYIHFYGNRSKLDREVYSDRPIRISVVATDGGSPHHSSTAVVNIFLTDINDNKPTVIFPDVNKDIAFVQVPQKNAKVAENAAMHAASRSGKNTDWSTVVVYEKTNHTNAATLTKIQAIDRDEGKNAQLSYSIVDGDGNHFFEVDMEHGNVTFSENADVYSIHLGCHILKVMITDLGEPRLSSNAFVNLYFSRDNAESVNMTKAMLECKSNPLFPKVTDHTLSTAGMGMTLYIIIGLAAVVFIIIIAIVIVLITCCCRGKQKKSRSYNCQQGTGWSSSPSEIERRKNMQKRRSGRRMNDGTGTVDSRSSFHSEWTASQTHIGQDKLDKVRVLPDLQSEGSGGSHQSGHDSGTGDSMPGENYHHHGMTYTDHGMPHPQDMDPRFTQPQMSYSQNTFGHPMDNMHQGVHFIDPQKMYNPNRTLMTPKCTDECLIYGHGDACWMPDSLLRSPSGQVTSGVVDLPPQMMYQSHPADPHGGLRYHGDPSTPYYYDPGQKFAHLGNSDHGSEGYSQHGSGEGGVPSHVSYQTQDPNMLHQMHAASPHPHQRMYQNELDERAYINLQGYDPTQNQTEDIHSSLSSASSNTNPYNAGLPQNHPRYHPDPNRPHLFYQVPNQSTPRYDMHPATQPSYYPNNMQDYHPAMNPNLVHEQPRPQYKEDFSASNLLPVANDREAMYNQQWDHSAGAHLDRQPLMSPYDQNRMSNAEPSTDQENLIRNMEAAKSSPNNNAQNTGNAKVVDEKLTTIEEHEPVVNETDGLLL